MWIGKPPGNRIQVSGAKVLGTSCRLVPARCQAASTRYERIWGKPGGGVPQMCHKTSARICQILMGHPADEHWRYCRRSICTSCLSGDWKILLRTELSSIRNCLANSICISCRVLLSLLWLKLEKMIAPSCRNPSNSMPYGTFGAPVDRRHQVWRSCHVLVWSAAITLPVLGG